MAGFANASLFSTLEGDGEGGGSSSSTIAQRNESRSHTYSLLFQLITVRTHNLIDAEGNLSQLSTRRNYPLKVRNKCSRVVASVVHTSYLLGSAGDDDVNGSFQCPVY